MKMIKTLSMAVVVAGLMATTTQAVPIVGSIGFSGVFTQNGGTVGDLTTATSMTLNSVNVDTSDVDLAGASSWTFASPIAVNPANGLVGNQLWKVWVGPTPYEFAVTTENQILSDPKTLVIQGIGNMTRNSGQDSTPGEWQLSFGVSGSAPAASFTWQSTSATIATATPDGGSTLILLGSAIMGLFAIARKSVRIA